MQKLPLTRPALLLAAAAAIALPMALAQQPGPQEISFSATGEAGSTEAPVTIAVFSDFACPFSSEMFFTLEKLEARYPGKIRLLLKNSPLPIHPDAVLAHRAALAAGEQGRFGPMAELLYANQKQQSEAALDAYARRLGLDMERFHRDEQSAATGGRLAGDMEEGRALGVSETPTMFLNGKRLTGTQSLETLAHLVDSALGSLEAPALPAGIALPPALLAEIQSHPSAEAGTPGAPLTIVEFTDFQCPYCRAAAAPMEQLMAVRGRQVRWVYRAFPLDFHQNAEFAAEAALAAGAQGKFWPMHDLLFSHQGALQPADLHGYAAQLNLDLTAFDEALRTHRYAAEVAADRALGEKVGVEGTPTFVIDGRAMTGVRSLTELEQLADAHASAQGPVVAGVALPPPVAPHVVLGKDAKPGLTITWYTDVRSPLAERQAALIASLAERYRGRVRVLYKPFAMAAHPDSLVSAQALLAASAQGRFWELYRALASRRETVDEGSLVAMASALGMDSARFHRSMLEASTAVAADLEEAARRGILGAPTIFVNERRVDGLQREDFYAGIAEEQLRGSSGLRQAAVVEPLR